MTRAVITNGLWGILLALSLALVGGVSCSKDSFTGTEGAAPPPGDDGGTPPSSIRQLALGGRFSCALLDNGHVRCWGANDAGQAGREVGTSRDVNSGVTPGEVVGLTDAVNITAGWESACAVRQGGHVVCWGATPNPAGSSPEYLRTPELKPVLVSPGQELSDATQVSGKTRHYCAVRKDGSVVCWGSAADPLLNGTPNAPSPSLAARLISVTDIERVATGAYHACGLKKGGTVICWGAKNRAQLGSPLALEYSSTPELVAGLTDVVDITAGVYHTCARKSDGSAFCWGENGIGQAGPVPKPANAPPVVQTPTRIPGIPQVAEIATGLTVTCVRAESGLVHCWGANNFGQLGASDETFGFDSEVSNPPVNVPGLGDVGQIAIGEEHVCVVLRDGHTIKCWGTNWAGTITFGNRAYVRYPRPVAGLKATALASGWLSTCALTQDKEVYCWGWNNHGQVGNGKVETQSSLSTPTKVAGLSNVVQIAAGDDHVCATLQDATVWCWGNNAQLQLGRASASIGTGTPGPIPGVSGALSISAYQNVTCVQLADFHVSCWGSGFDDLSRNVMRTQTETYKPRAGIIGRCGRTASTNYDLLDCWNGVHLMGFAYSIGTDFSSSGREQCARIWLNVNEARINCFGSNTHGQLGVGTHCDNCGEEFPDPTLAMTNLPEPDVTQVFAGYENNCAMVTNGSVNNGVVCWGKGWLSGVESDDDQLVPPKGTIAGLSNIKQVSLGNDHICAVDVNGAVSCWGDNHVGQLADGAQIMVTTPTAVNIF